MVDLLSLWWQSLKCITFVASELEHCGNDIHFCQDVQYTVSLTKTELRKFAHEKRNC